LAGSVSATAHRQPVGQPADTPPNLIQPAAIFTRLKRGERRKAAGQPAAMAAASGQRPPHQFEDVQPAGQSFAARAALSLGCPRDVEARAKHILTPPEQTASGASGRGPGQPGRSCCCWAAILGTRQLQTAWLPRSSARSGRWRPWLSACSSSSPRACRRGDCNTRLLCRQLGQESARQGRPGFSPHNKRRTVPQCQRHRGAIGKRRLSDPVHQGSNIPPGLARLQRLSPGSFGLQKRGSGR